MNNMKVFFSYTYIILFNHHSRVLILLVTHIHFAGMNVPDPLHKLYYHLVFLKSPLIWASFLQFTERATEDQTVKDLL